MAAEAVPEAGTVPAAEDLTVQQALIQVRALRTVGVLYRHCFVDDDGQILRRFARNAGLEAWVCAMPVTPEGRRDRRHQMIVCAIHVDARSGPDDRQQVEDDLKAELEAALEKIRGPRIPA